MKRKRIVLVIGMALLLVTAGCVGADDAPEDHADVEEEALEAEAPVDDAAEPDESAEEFATGEPDAGDVDRLAADRQLIRTGYLRLEVDNFSTAADTVREEAIDRGGFVGESTRDVRERDGDHWTRGTIEIRVPNDEFDETIAELESLGVVHTAETETEDVTEQLLDIEARLENLRVQRDRLRDLYEDANETDDVLAVQRELSSVQEEIERLEAQQQSLQEAVALSTITVHLSEEPPESEPEPNWYETEVTAAFLESIDGVVVAIRALVVGGAYLAPYLLVFGTPIAAAFGGVYWHRSRRGEVAAGSEEG